MFGIIRIQLTQLIDKAMVLLHRIGVITQQIFRKQDANDVVLVALHYGKTRVCCFNDKRYEFFRRLADVYDIHLRARDHDFADLSLGNLHHTLHHGQGIGIQQVAFICGMQQFDKLFAVFRLAQQHRGKPL